MMSKPLLSQSKRHHLRTRLMSVTESNIQKASVKSTMLECFANVVPEPTPDDQAITSEEVQDIFGGQGTLE